MTTNGNNTPPTTLSAKIDAAKHDLPVDAEEQRAAALEKINARCKEIESQMASAMRNAVIKERKLLVKFSMPKQALETFGQLTYKMTGRHADIIRLEAIQNLMEKARELGMPIRFEYGKSELLLSLNPQMGAPYANPTMGGWLVHMAKDLYYAELADCVATFLGDLDDDIARYTEAGLLGPIDCDLRCILNKGVETYFCNTWLRSREVTHLIEKLGSRGLRRYGDNEKYPGRIRFYLDPEAIHGIYGEKIQKALLRREEIVRQRLQEIESTLEKDLLTERPQAQAGYRLGEAIYNFPYFVDAFARMDRKFSGSYNAVPAEELAKTCPSFKAFLQRMDGNGMQVLFQVDGHSLNRCALGGSIKMLIIQA